MNTSLRHSVFFLAACALPAAIAAQQSLRPQPGRALRDTLPNGTHVRYHEPQKWNGKVLIDAFGYIAGYDSLTLPALARGYVVAAAAAGSIDGYWTLNEKNADVDAVRRDITRRYGANVPVYLFGESAGGYRVLSALERHPADYRGGVAFCALAPTSFDLSDPVIDMLVAFDHFFPGILTSFSSLGRIRIPAAEVVESALKSSADRAAQLVKRFEVKREDFAGVVVFYAAIVREFQTQAKGNPFDVMARQFTGLGDDTEFNRRVRRFAADSAAARTVRERFHALTGTLTVPALIVENAYDEILPARTVQAYAAIVAKAGAANWLVVNDVPGAGHCRMSAGEKLAALDRLVAWAERGTKPAPGTIPAAAVTYPTVTPGPASKIDGIWQYVQGQSNGRRGTTRDTITVTVAQSVFRVSRNGQQQPPVGLEFMTQAMPWKVDFHDLAGDTWFALVEIKADTMRLTYLLPEERAYRDRPTEFKESGQQIQTYVRLRR